jgi:hypothetical protein
MAACAGAGNAAGGYLNSLIWGDDYSWSDAGKDFAWGAGTTLALGGLGKAGGKIFEKTKAVQWLDKNIVPHLPAKLRGQYKCPPTEAPTLRPGPNNALRGEDGRFAKNPNKNSKPAKKATGGAKNGETEATARGKKVHKEWDYGPGWEKEYVLPSGDRVDAINIKLREVIELKPNNARQIREGNTQLAGYLAELNREFPGKAWTGKVITYD